MGAERAGASPGTSMLVWYVAYGSNMDPDRLACYLEGGRPPGARRTYVGSRDPSPPRSSRSVHIPHRRFFAGESRVWGGGVAFVDTEPSEATLTAAVAHLVTVEQLVDLAAQESGGEAPGAHLATLPAEGEQLAVGSARYDLLVGLAPIDDVAAVVLTSSAPPVANDPSPAYAEMLDRGLARWHVDPRG